MKASGYRGVLCYLAKPIEESNFALLHSLGKGRTARNPEDSRVDISTPLAEKPKSSEAAIEGPWRFAASQDRRRFPH